MKVVIINSVPLNTGDEALLLAITQALYQRFGKVEIDVCCTQEELCRQHIQGYRFHPDYEYTLYRFPSTLFGRGMIFFKKVVFKLFGFKTYLKYFPFLRSKEERKNIRLFQTADLIISSPGGYLHDFYYYQARFLTFKLLFFLKKPLFLIAQSIGPFWKEALFENNRNILNQVQAISVREAYSYDHIQKLGVQRPAITITTDQAFALHDPKQLTPKKKPQKPLQIVMNIRWWKDQAQTTTLIAQAIQFCAWLIETHQTKITFLSTCQGIADYRDDSQIAKQIVEQLPKTLHAYITIDDRHYHPLELIQKSSEFDAYIGMRLHGAILAMLGGTPALNIGYEDKTKGIYEMLNLSAYMFDHGDGINKWQLVTNRFLDNLDNIQQQLPLALDRAKTKANANIDILQDYWSKAERNAE